MGTLSNYAENNLLNHILKNTAYVPEAIVYVALGTLTEDSDDGIFTEATYGNYAREAITFGAASSRTIMQTGLIEFNQATSGNETYTHYVIYETISGSDQLAWGVFNNAINVVINSTPSIASGEIQIEVLEGSGSGMSTVIAHNILNFMFRNIAYAQPTNLYVALATTVLTDDTTGTDIVEPVANNYNRTLYNTWTVATTGVSSNSVLIQLPTPSGAWGNVKSTAILDAATDGNVIIYDNANVVDQDIGLNDDVQFIIGAFDIAMD